MKNILLMCSFGARADEPARASSGRAHEKFVAGDSGGGTVDEGTAAAAPTDSRSNANKRSPRRARHGGDSGDGSATAPFVIDTVARARYPLGHRWGMESMPHPGPLQAAAMPGAGQGERPTMPGVGPGWGITKRELCPGCLFTVKPEVCPTPYRARATAYITPRKRDMSCGV